MSMWGGLGSERGPGVPVVVCEGVRDAGADTENSHWNMSLSLPLKFSVGCTLFPVKFMLTL